MSHIEPINFRLSGLWHGGDYNPEQWPPNVWDEDVRLMKEARCRVATLGVFSWSKLEPAEGRFEFGWLDEVISRLEAADRYFILATPSAAPPAWMARAYPEILRTGPDRVRRRHGNRVNYSLWSPVYREKTRTIARELARRYGQHPRLLAWHVSNEYGGDDYGPHTITAFRQWLREKYETLDALNAAYWTAFWSHVYTDWEEIDAPGEPYAESSIHGLTLDWRRFITDSTLDFMLNEAAPLREFSPDVPVTTNFMGTYPGLDYRRFTPHIDFSCWDSYPAFAGPLEDTSTWLSVAFKHDLTRCLSPNGRWAMMECSPSSSNWYRAMSLKRPGMHRFEVLQAIAHGADGALYFQWRQSRGCQEQHHGAVVNHGTTTNGRVFQEVRGVGIELDSLADLAGAEVVADVALVYDWTSRWALEASCGPTLGNKGYEATCQAHYRAFWEAGIAVDIVGQDADLSRYRVVVAPMAYSLSPGFAERVKEFVRGGGFFVATYLSGWTDQNGLIFEKGYLGPLREVLGIWSEETDALLPGRVNEVRVSGLGIDGAFEAVEFCELIHLAGAQCLGEYQEDFYAGRPAVTVNALGRGRAFYVASRNEQAFTSAFLQAVAREAGVLPLVADLPAGVTVQRRVGASQEWLFFMNASPIGQVVSTPDWGSIQLPPWAVEIRSRARTCEDAHAERVARSVSPSRSGL